MQLAIPATNNLLQQHSIVLRQSQIPLEPTRNGSQNARVSLDNPTAAPEQPIWKPAKSYGRGQSGIRHPPCSLRMPFCRTGMRPGLE